MDSEPRSTDGSLPDLDALDARAREARPNEAFHLVSSGKDHRLGVVVTASPDGGLVHSIELLICTFSGRTELRLPLMERALRLTRELKERGYLLVHEDDGWVSCGRPLPRGDVAAECGVLMRIIMAFTADRQVMEDDATR